MQEGLEGKIGSVGNVQAKVHISLDGKKPDIDEPYILIAKYSNPNMAPAMFGAIGIVTEEGGLMSHLAVVAREIKIPCIVGVTNATDYLDNSQLIKLDALAGLGKIGKVYKL